MASLAAKYPNVEIIDPEPFLCTNVLCPVTTRNGIVLYEDDDHISVAAAQAFALRGR
jgi:hypothetical protein